MLALFTENFDYQDMRKHFVKGTLESDVLGKKILSYTISDQYAARVGSLPAYDIVRYPPISCCEDIIFPSNLQKISLLLCL